MSDPLSIHRYEQATAAFIETARMTWAYFKALTDSGFSPQQALVLTRDMHAVWMQQALAPKKEGA